MGTGTLGGDDPARKRGDGQKRKELSSLSMKESLGRLKDLAQASGTYFGKLFEVEKSASRTLSEIVDLERKQIAKRRKSVTPKPLTVTAGKAPSDARVALSDHDAAVRDESQPGRVRHLAGLALSGGGIRSATFCLGLLQAFAKLDLLNRFDYLSTVSGGGFVGGWWTAIGSRSPTGSTRNQHPPFAPPERIDTAAPGSSAMVGVASLAAVESAQQSSEDVSSSGSGTKAAGRPRPTDPLRHLRLFSNYLTPRVGLLSIDTWRAVAFVLRNLGLTWFVLGLMIIGGLSLTQSSVGILSVGADVRNSSPFCDVPFDATLHPRRDNVATGAAESAPLSTPEETQEQRCRDWHVQRLTALSRTAEVAAGVLVGLSVAWLIFAYGLSVNGTRVAALLTSAVWGGIAWQLPTTTDWARQALRVSAVLVAAVVVVYCIVFTFGALMGRTEKAQDGADLWYDVHRNRLGRHLGGALALFTVGLVLITFVSYAQEMWSFLTSPTMASRLTRLGGSVASFAGIFSALGIARGGQRSRVLQQTPFRRGLLEVIAILLVAIVLALASIAVVNLSLQPVGGAAAFWARRLSVALSAGVILLAVRDVFSGDTSATERKRFVLVVSGAAAAVTVLTLLMRFAPYQTRSGVATADLRGRIVSALVMAVATTFAYRVVTLLPRKASSRQDSPVVHLTVYGALLLASIASAVLRPDVMLSAPPHGRLWVAAAYVLALVICIVIGEHVVFKGDHVTALWLMLAASTSIVGWLIIAALDGWRSSLSFHEQTFLMCVSSLGLATIVGWLADPNELSLHGFYRSRLARAYLGASNPDRNTVDGDARVAVPGDDLALSECGRGVSRGMPYPLINTTLNLVGGRDLAAAQRPAEHFLLSPLFCGSVQTCFRETKPYMTNRMTLSTAVAISGAAVSPNMGAMRVSATVSALMSALNVRLGFWIPTPDQRRWRQERPTLWPYYLLRETFSQTHALAPFCYLTDGGHFENTGIYALLQRGCRLIVVADCGADSNGSCEDMGNAVRRARIDLRAEVTFKHLPTSALDTDGTRVVVGDVLYSLQHLLDIGELDDEIGRDEDRTGRIVWIKPRLIEAHDSVDVLNYGRQHSAFPQQSTAEQWFDEAQFESYRKLGETIGAEVFA